MQANQKRKGVDSMKKIVLLFSHQVTETQKEELHKNWKIDEFVVLPYNLQQIWSNIPADAVSIVTLLEPIKIFLSANVEKGDLALIQGDFGAVYDMINYVKSLELTPVYATTKRIVSEYKNEEGKTVKKSIFEHRRFREYE